tara:strand:- start:731 stop:1318 length:588 start_codon:yes stop_codon:yes gene_type:complete
MPVLTSQQEADALSRLNLGTSGDILNNSPDSPLGSLLKDLVQGVVDELGRSLDKYGVRGTNKLKQTMHPTPVSIGANGVEVGISAEFYWKFVNYGVNGSEVNRGAPSWGSVSSPDMSFKESISIWRAAKGIALPEGFKDYEAFDNFIMYRVVTQGQEPRPFFTDVVNERLVDVLKKPIEKLIGRAIAVKIIEPWQ